MRPVVAAVDGSERTGAVVAVARRLAKALGLELVLLTVAPPTEAPGVSAVPAGQERLREEERRDAEALLERVASDEGVGEGARRLVRTGPAADRIVDVCADEGAELVVLGSHGRGGLKRTLLGSVSTEVAAHAPCPCVIVSPSAAEHAFLE